MHADFSSSTVLIKPADEKRERGPVYKRNGPRSASPTLSGKATGVSYVDKTRPPGIPGERPCDRGQQPAPANPRGCCSIQNHPQHKNGLANSSGVVGKYLARQLPALRAGAFLPALMDRKRYNEDGVGGMHMYVAIRN